MQVVISGAGNFGREVAGWLTKSGIKPSGFVDDEIAGCVRTDAYVRCTDEFVVVAVADPAGRESVVERLRKRGAAFRGLELQMAAPDVKIGNGSILCPYSLVSCGAKIGEFVIVNVMTSVGHDVTIGDYCTLSSHVDVCGHVTIGKRVFIGSGATILPGVQIGDDVKIGAGAIVHNDCPSGTTMYAAPARTLR